MNREQKAATVEEIAGQLQAAEAVFAIDYRGISVPQAAQLRTQLREVGASFRIVKNSLTELAADQAGAPSLRALLEGPTALTFVQGDAATAAKALADFARTQPVLEFKGGLLNGEELSAEQIRDIARLPARDVLFAQMVGTVAAPLTGLVRGLNGLVCGLAVALGQIAEQGLVGGGADAVTEPEAEPATTPETATEPGPPAEAEAEAPEPEPEADAPEAEQPADADAPQSDEPEAEEEA